jgi:methylmalonyl-CoA mutase N-terminal domain/subunit
MNHKKLRQWMANWNEGLVKKLLSSHKERKRIFETDSGIKVELLYTPLHLEEIGFDYANDLGFPGQYPFTRGKDPLGYRTNYWIFQQYAGFGDAEEANKRYRFLLEHGQTGISIALDLPTQIGLDSDHPMAEGEVGKVGVAIDSLDDLEVIFKGIPLNKPRQISLVANATALIGLAMFIALARNQGIATDQIVLRIQNDILKEFIARNTYIFPPKASLRLATDLVIYCAENHPNWLPLTACGYHIREAGASASQEIAFTIANALEYMKDVHERGGDVERVLPKLSTFMSVSMNFFEEIAKFRALRRLWARSFSEHYSIKDLSNLNFNLVNFTAGSSLTAQQPMNNVVRVAIECLAGVLGGCQSLFPCSMDEAYCTPTENSVKLALRTQQIIAHETGIADTIDPLGGSYYVETLTSALEAEARKYLEEIEKTGGVIKAIESGYFQEKIGESSYRQQRQVEKKEKIIVGMNEFVDDEELPVQIFRPPEDTAEKQKIKLKKLRETRDKQKVNEALRELERLAGTNENLVPILIQAVSRYATVGEICDVFRRVFGEYRETKFY